MATDSNNLGNDKNFVNYKTTYHVRNVMVLKEKNSEFLDLLIEIHFIDSVSPDGKLIKGKCPIIRCVESGNYFIYTFDNIKDKERQLIKSFEADWI